MFAAIACFVLCAIAVWAVVLPLFGETNSTQQSAMSESEGSNRRARLEQVMVDLELDQSTGKLDQHDFEQMKASLRSELKSLDS